MLLFRYDCLNFLGEGLLCFDVALGRGFVKSFDAFVGVAVEVIFFIGSDDAIAAIFFDWANTLL